MQTKHLYGLILIWNKGVINIQDYANEIFYFNTIGWKDLSNCITDDIITCSKDIFGAEFSLYLLFL